MRPIKVALPTLVPTTKPSPAAALPPNNNLARTKKKDGFISGPAANNNHVLVPQQQHLVPGIHSNASIKTELYSTEGDPLTLDDIKKRFSELFPNEPFIIRGDFARGLIVYSTVNDLHLLAIPSNCLIASAFHYGEGGKITSVDFGGEARSKHHNYSIIDATNSRTRADMERCIDYLHRPQASLMSTFERDQRLRESGAHTQMTLSGALQVGFERECWMLDPKTGELANIHNDELLVGCVEIDEGVYITPLHAARGMANEQKKLEAKYGEFLIVNTSTPPSGSPRQTEINTYNEPAKEKNLGPYIAVVESYCYRRYRPHTRFSRLIREQQALRHGYQDADQMIDEHGDCRTWSTAAAHTNMGLVNTYNPDTQRFVVDFELARNVSNIALSELGAIARMLMASSAYITDIVPNLDGQNPIDTREFIRQDMGTALSHNQPIRNAKHYREIVEQTMTSGENGADRLARAVVAHTDDNGNYHATAHGAGRWRFEDTGGPSGRLEYTGAASTSILPKARAMAILQMLEGIAMLATHAGQDVFDYIQTNYGISATDAWGDADGTVQEFMLMGRRSPKGQALFDKLTHIISQTKIPALEDTRLIALAALRDIRYDAHFTGFATGKGTLGGALLHLAKEGYTGLDAAKVVDAFLRQESEYISKANDAEVTRYLLGGGNFKFAMPAALTKKAA